jgi:AraC-like DNA-binding protein
MARSSLEGAYTMSIRLVEIVGRGLEAAGVEPRDVLARVGLDGIDQQDADLRVSHADGLRLIDAAVEAAGDECFGLHAAELYRPGAHTMEFLAASSENIGEAVERVCRYYRLLVDAAAPRLDVEGDIAIWRFRMRGALPISRTLAELIMGVAAIAVKVWTSREAPPSEYHFTHRRPADITSYQRIFGSKLHFGADENYMIFPVESLQRPLTSANPELSRLLESHAEELLARHASADELIPRVRELMADELKRGRTQASELAQRLGMSARTLRRHLQANDTSHQALLADLRRERAESLLAEHDVSIEEVAMMLGFSEPSTFHRAFKRWTDRTPLEFRRGVWD